MKTRQFSIDEVVVSVRDVERSNRGTVISCEENGFVLVQFADGMPRRLPVQSVERVSESRPGSVGQGAIWAESADFGDYLHRMGEADSISKKGAAK